MNNNIFEYIKVINQKSKAAFDADVADPNTETTEDDFSQHVEITVAKLTLFGSTKE